MPRLHGRSAELTGNSAVYTGRCVFHGIAVATDGTNDVTVTLYDNTAASGGKVVPTFKVTGSDNLGGIVGIDSICDTGLYLAMSGGSPKAVVYYTPKAPRP